MVLQFCDAWERNYRQVSIEVDNEVVKDIELSKDLLKEMDMHTVFVLSKEKPQILGLINRVTGVLCLGYRAESGIYNKLAGAEEIEQEVMECFA